MDLYDIARQVTDEVMGDGAYAEVNRNNPNPGVQAAIRRTGEEKPMPAVPPAHSEMVVGGSEAEAFANWVRKHVSEDDDVTITRQGDGSLVLTTGLSTCEITTGGTVLVDGEEAEE